MKKLILLFLALSLYSAPTKELSVMDAQVYTNMQQNDRARSYNSRVQEAFDDKVELAINARFSKQSVIQKEVFYLDIDINTSYTNNFTPKIIFNKSVDWQILNSNINFDANNGKYHTRVYMQTNSVNARLNSIKIDLYRNTQIVGEGKLSLEPINIEELSFNKSYSNLVASNLELKNIKCTDYDDTSIICGMDAKAKNTNFKNFYLQNALSQSVTNVSKDYENASCSIALIFNKSSKSFSFSYYDLDQNKLIDFTKDIVIESEEISTQTNLNPITKEINFYLQIVALVIAVICLAIVLITKKYFSLIAVAIVCVVYSFLDENVSKEAVLKTDSNVRILPTHTSTIFYKNPTEHIVKVLTSEGGYTKISLDENTSGWVKNEDLK